MDNRPPNLNNELPFFNCSNFTISQLFQTAKNNILETLQNNSFSKNTIQLVNGFSKDNYTCNYYHEESINDLSRKHSAKSLKVFHQNIESFGKNSNELISNLDCLNFTFDIICLTEVRRTSLALIEMVFPDYLIYLDNPATAKGGVALLLKKNKFSNITELGPGTGFDLKGKCNCTHCLIENKWLRFNINNQVVIIGGIYRHPKGNIEHFNNALNNVTSKINDNTLAIVLGDININLISENEKVQTYINNFLAKNFIPCITLPTRIRNYSTTLIDHIFIKNPRKLIQNKCSSGNLIFDITDHLPNFMFLNIEVPLINDRPYIRLFTENRIKLFNDNLANETDLISNNDLVEVDSTYELFSNNYLKLFNKYFPYVKQSRKSFKDKPYITREIKTSIKIRNTLYKKHLNNPTDLNTEIWRRYRNKTTQTIKRAQEHYYNNILKGHQNNSKNLWKTFGRILNKNKHKHNSISSLNIDGNSVTDPQLITESFNNFFSQIGENLASKFSRDNNTDYKKYLGSPADQSILLHKISQKEIDNAIKNLKNSSSSGPDEITSKFVKLSAPILIPALDKIFNLALKSGIYPNKLKIAKVVPVYKKGVSTLVSNYRPISILNTINKIFEKILHIRLTKFIEDSNLLYKYQFGFRKNHSTELALIEIVDQIRLSLDNNNMTCGIFIDLSKAFDTVNHDILIGKLEHYGIRGKALDLIRSYLNDREQYAIIDKCKSSTKPIRCGVPQGSVLGPLFFILFINDLPNCCPLGNVRIFADDTNVFFHGASIEELIKTAKDILSNLNYWFAANKLTLNADKSSFTIFKSQRKKIDNIPNSINFLNYKIERTSSVRFLGLVLDENLNFDLHINEVCNKLKTLFHVFYSIRNFLSKENIKTIYYSLIYSRIKYGIAVYGQAGLTKMKRIQILQNRLLKVLAGKKNRYSTDKLHDDFELLKVADIANQEILTFVFNYFSGNLPPVFQNYYVTFAELHNINTRNANNHIRYIDHNTNIAADSVKIKGAALWNRLSNATKNSLNTKIFRSAYKMSLFPYNHVI